ncbi:nesp071 [Neophasia sp. alphabaculovirus]|nr:nesp071 [Neophasia sp. alphabaculovirus]
MFVIKCNGARTIQLHNPFSCNMNVSFVVIIILLWLANVKAGTPARWRYVCVHYSFILYNNLII